MKYPQILMLIPILLPLLFATLSCAQTKKPTTIEVSSEDPSPFFETPFDGSSMQAPVSSIPSPSNDPSLSEPHSPATPTPFPTPSPAPSVSPSVELSTSPTPSPSLPVKEPEESDLVLVKDYLPTAVIDLRYATENNFTGTVIYEDFDCYLRYGTVKKLMAAAEELEEKGVYFKIWDAYRPVWAQFKLWEICPDPTFVSNPNVGFSSHSRGNTVDITLVDKEGNELLMPSAFDEFSSAADRDYSDLPEEQRSNALLLEQTLYLHGFRGYAKEWWHYTDKTEYPVVTD